MGYPKNDLKTEIEIKKVVNETAVQVHLTDLGRQQVEPHPNS